MEIDINKLKLLINAEIIENRSNYALFNEGMKKGSEIAQSIILHQNRWRKVEEEMPEYRDNDYQVLGLLNNGEYKTIWVIKDSLPQIEVFAYHSVAEWKPIS